MKVMKTRRGNPKEKQVTPGLNIDNIVYSNDNKKHSVAGIELEDTKNRRYVMNNILENMSKGITEEEALDIIMKDNIVQKFKYLEDNGCNIKECFRNWTRGYKNRKDKERVR